VYYQILGFTFKSENAPLARFCQLFSTHLHLSVAGKDMTPMGICLRQKKENPA
jgi:hypothetical protein